MTISQETIAEILKLGGQYFLPVAALLRAIYSGFRGKFPEGFSQIALASLFAGITAAVQNEQLDLRSVALTVLGNTVFTAGLLSFTMLYLLRQPDRGQVVDGVIGGILGFIAWIVWVVVLLNEWPVWTIVLAIAAGAGGFIVLRILMRQIARMVKIATYLIVIGLILAVGGGALLLIHQFTATSP